MNNRTYKCLVGIAQLTYPIQTPNLNCLPKKFTIVCLIVSEVNASTVEVCAHLTVQKQTSPGLAYEYQSCGCGRGNKGND